MCIAAMTGCLHKLMSVARLRERRVPQLDHDPHQPDRYRGAATSSLAYCAGV